MDGLDKRISNLKREMEMEPEQKLPISAVYKVGECDSGPDYIKIIKK